MYAPMLALVPLLGETPVARWGSGWSVRRPTHRRMQACPAAGGLRRL